jgi:hypothetical protein
MHQTYFLGDGKSNRKRKKTRDKEDLSALGSVSVPGYPVFAHNLLYVVDKEEQTERKRRREKPGGSWPCKQSQCPSIQPPPRGKERGIERGKRR